MMEQQTFNEYEHSEYVDAYLRAHSGNANLIAIDILKNYLPQGSSLLELGIGGGFDLDLLTNHYLVTGSDSSEEFLRRYSAKQPKADLLMLDAIYIDTDRVFDGIYSNKVLHHLSLTQLEKSLLHQSERLNPSGIICHTFWKGTDTTDRNGMIHQEYEIDTLTDVVEMNFDILKVEVYSDENANDSILILACKAD